MKTLVINYNNENLKRILGERYNKYSIVEHYENGMPNTSIKINNKHILRIYLDMMNLKLELLYPITVNFRGFKEFKLVSKER